jgi:hypothetical protein
MPDLPAIDAVSPASPAGQVLASAPCSVAALFVAARGCYADLPGVDPWPESRDARGYSGPLPVVAHPPCSRWCRLAGLVEARWGHKRGDDAGCFAAALESVRKWGGVLEHPAYSAAFAAHGLPDPPNSGWMRTFCGGWVCYIEQGRFGHPAKKATWLYAHGVAWLPDLPWGRTPDGVSTALVSWCGNKVKRTPGRPRVGKSTASATPHEFRDVLLRMARSCPRNV